MKSLIVLDIEEPKNGWDIKLENQFPDFMKNGSKKDIECIKLFYDENNTKFKM